MVRSPACWLLFVLGLIGAGCASDAGVADTTVAPSTPASPSPVSAPAPTTTPASAALQSGPEWFGFIGGACGVDDPHDDEDRTDYVDEMVGFTNLTHVCVTSFDQRDELARIAEAGGAALLDVSLVLFEFVAGESPSGSGQELVLRGDAEVLWDEFVALNASVLDSDHVAALYLMDEPVWNGASRADIEAAAAIVEATLPHLPTVVIEAPDTLGQAVFPESVDWVGFDRYGVADPAIDAIYQADLETLRSLAVPGQEIVIVLDSQWHPVYDEVGLSVDDMAEVARNYFEFTQNTDDVAALIGYSWPGGIDGPEQLGARDLPADVRAAYEEIGRTVLDR